MIILNLTFFKKMLKIMIILNLHFLENVENHDYIKSTFFRKC